MAKLSEEDVRKILKRYKNGERAYFIAREYKVTNECIYDIVHKKVWKHIHEEGGKAI
ncbi:hypothetical protein AGMMS50268_03940 [Spirochaetia bacterium]|nr:hypothetical protein AGMMS50268_03940 [Spirochaetia bacterium]